MLSRGNENLYLQPLLFAEKFDEKHIQYYPLTRENSAPIVQPVKSNINSIISAHHKEAGSVRGKTRLFVTRIVGHGLLMMEEAVYKKG